MSVRIQVEHLQNSSLAGRRTHHGSGVVRLGRAHDNDIVFDANRDLLVSAHHLQFERQGGSQLLARDLGATNGTFIDSVPLKGSTLVPRGARIQLGPEGPVLTAWIGQDDEPAPQPVQAAPEEPMFAPPEVSSRPTRAAPPAAKEPMGRGTFLELLGAHTARERRRRLLLLFFVLVVVGGVTAYLLTREPPKEKIRTVEKTETVREVVTVREIEKSSPPSSKRTAASSTPKTTPASGPAPTDWSQVLGRLRDRVYLVTRIDPETGNANGMGTAWSLDEKRGLLATNAHVAVAFHKLKRGQYLVARSARNPPVDLRIEDVVLHPSYIPFLRIWNRYHPLGETRTGMLDPIPAYDVALLEIRRSDRTNQAEGLVLAPAARHLDLTSGDDLAYAGFPLEGQAMGGTDEDRPTPVSQRFTLSRMTDLFMARPDSPRQGLLLTYALLVSGGASGSPVVNERCEVVGLVSAGNVQGTLGGARVGSGGTCYGPRSDLVQELVADTASGQLEHRATRDRAGLLRTWYKNKPTTTRLANAGGYPMLYPFGKNPRSNVGLAAKPVVAQVSRDNKTQASFKLPRPGRYGLFVASMDDPVLVKTLRIGPSTFPPQGSWHHREEIVSKPDRTVVWWQESKRKWQLVEKLGADPSITVRVEVDPESMDQAGGRVFFALYAIEE